MKVLLNMECVLELCVPMKVHGFVVFNVVNNQLDRFFRKNSCVRFSLWASVRKIVASDMLCEMHRFWRSVRFHTSMEQKW